MSFKYLYKGEEYILVNEFIDNKGIRQCFYRRVTERVVIKSKKEIFVSGDNEVKQIQNGGAEWQKLKDKEKSK